jgi:hypothetical protein
MDYPTKFSIVMKNGFKIYPVFKIDRSVNVFAVKVEDEFNLVFKLNKTVGEYKHNSKTINKALNETVNYIYNKIKDKV